MITLIAIGGATGAGKTTLAYALRRAEQRLSQALVVEGDQMRRELLGYDLAYAMMPEDYTPEVSQRVRDHLDAKTREALMAGRSVIDASGFWREDGQRHIEQLAASCGARFIGLWLTAPQKVLASRVEKRLGERTGHADNLSVEKGHASDACLGVLEREGELPPPASPNWKIVEGGLPTEEIVKNVLLTMSF